MDYQTFATEMEEIRQHLNSAQQGLEAVREALKEAEAAIKMQEDVTFIRKVCEKIGVRVERAEREETAKRARSEAEAVNRAKEEPKVAPKPEPNPAQKKAKTVPSYDTGALTLGEALDAYLERKEGDIAEKTLAAYRAVTLKVPEEYLDIPVDGITSDEISQIVNRTPYNSTFVRAVVCGAIKAANGDD